MKKTIAENNEKKEEIFPSNLLHRQEFCRLMRTCWIKGLRHMPAAPTV